MALIVLGDMQRDLWGDLSRDEGFNSEIDLIFGGLICLV